MPQERKKKEANLALCSIKNLAIKAHAVVWYSSMHPSSQHMTG